MTELVSPAALTLFVLNSHFLHSRVVSGEFAATLEPFPGVGNAIFTVEHVFCIFGQRAFTAVFSIGSAVHGLWKIGWVDVSVC